MVGAARITDQNIRYINKMITGYFEEESRNFISVSELWEYLQRKGKRSDKGYVDTLVVLKRVLIALEEKGKVMVSEEDVIYPM